MKRIHAPRLPRPRFVKNLPLFLLLAALAASAPVYAGVLRVPLAPGVSAASRNGRSLLLEYNRATGPEPKAFAAKYLTDVSAWKTYQGLTSSIAVPFDKLNPAAQREVLLAIFPYDVVTSEGWTHYVLHEEDSGPEALWTLCRWLTGKGNTYKEIQKINKLETDKLHRGQQLLFPKQFLLDALRKPTGERPAPPGLLTAAPLAPAKEPANTPLHALAPRPAAGTNELEYGRDAKGAFALYHLKRGEALYTDVVARFTDVDVQESAAAAILAACRVVMQRSNIRNERSIPVGQAIKIPMDMLSAQFMPEGSSERSEYQAMVLEARRLRGAVRSKDLAGVVVILDPGHGGRDHGAWTTNNRFSLYEDEINYDIACRIKQILESQTQATVYFTVIDRVQGYTPTNRTRFTHDTNEELLTTPRHRNLDGDKLSLNLRWYLANSIYRSEVARGIDPKKVVFSSIHCDKLHPSLRGAMIYVPGASGRRDKEAPALTLASYEKYKEVGEQNYASSTVAERRRDEALSRNFATVLLDELGKKRIKRHDRSAPIRAQIRRDGTSFVPAVLRNTMVPTKVLIETANLANDVDCARLEDPQWRQWFAEAYVNALKVYFAG
ncbi:MAG: N-acetylmuramoyl-L-alanine amidase family protein [Candidatus Hydrogenedentales bacterium]|jgi:N-acetylmuramoyl-L-alanine amidase